MALPSHHYIRVALLFLLAGGLAAAGAKLHRSRLRAVEQVEPMAPSPWALHTAAVTRGTVERGFPVLARVTATEEVTLSCQISGTLLEMGPREGVAVREGNLLARIDTRELREQREALEAELRGARADEKRLADDRDRAAKLLAEGTISERTEEAARTASTSAAERVRGLERQIGGADVRIGYGVITAPADGVIAGRFSEPGDVCQVGHPLYRLTVAGGARVEVAVPQSIRERVRPGTALLLRHGEEQRSVLLDRVHPALDALALGFAEADLPVRPFRLPSGSRVPALVVLDSVEAALRVPTRALLRPSGSGNGTVFKVKGEGDDAHIAAVPVGVVLEGRETAAVAGDLAEGDRVVIAHESVLLALRDGDLVVVERRGTQP